MSGATTVCTVGGCEADVSRKGFKLCYDHWKSQKSGTVTRCLQCDGYYETAAGGCPSCPVGASGATAPNRSEVLTATKLGKELGLSSQKTNLVLAELGWIEKAAKGWRLTKHGEKLGATQKKIRQTGVPYVVWPGGITTNRSLRSSVAELLGSDGSDSAVEAPVATGGADAAADQITEFRKRFPATHRARDGHMVRSRAEMLIDNLLYVSGLVHAYERRLPVEEDVYSDFYLPEKKVYVEYWGLENQPKYRARMEKKKAIYAKNGFNLVSLTDEHILNLDDVLPRLLIPFDISIG